MQFCIAIVVVVRRRCRRRCCCGLLGQLSAFTRNAECVRLQYQRTESASGGREMLINQPHRSKNHSI